MKLTHVINHFGEFTIRHTNDEKLSKRKRSDSLNTNYLKIIINMKILNYYL